MTENTKLVFKLDFNFILKDAEDNVMESVKAGIKAGSYITPDMYEPVQANRLLGRTISMSNDDLGGVAFDWYPVLLKGKPLEVSKAEAGILKAFVLNQRKEKNPNFSNVVVAQLLNVFDKSGYKE